MLTVVRGSGIGHWPLLHVKQFLFLYLNFFAFLCLLQTSSPPSRTEVPVTTKKTEAKDETNRYGPGLFQVFSHIADVYYIILLVKVVASIFPLALTPSIVGSVAQEKVH